MRVADFIKQLEPYKDFEIETTIHLKVCEEELQKRMYQYPYDNYNATLSIDDIGYSDRVVSLGVSIKEAKGDRFWTNFIIQDKEDSKPWLCASYDSFLTYERAMEAVERQRKNYRVLSAWIDRTSEDGDSTTVFHKCYINVVERGRE